MSNVLKFTRDSLVSENLFILSRTKISKTTSVICLNQTPIFEWYVGKHVAIRDWLACSKLVYYPVLNSQHYSVGKQMKKKNI